MRPAKDWPLEVARCSGCGLCQSVCPVYAHTGDMADSPRGKIGILESLFAGQLDAQKAAARLARCALCGKCARACPAGVDIPGAVRSARRMAGRGGKVWRRAATARPQLLDRLQRLASLAQSAARWRGWHMGPQLARKAWRPLANGRPGATEVWLFAGCVCARILPDVADAAVRALNKVGCSAREDGNFSCCGSLYSRQGQSEAAHKAVRRNLALVATRPNLPFLTLCPACLEEIRSVWPHVPGLSAQERALAEKLASSAQDASVFIAGRMAVSESGDRLQGAWHRGCMATDETEQAAFRLAQGAGMRLRSLGSRCCGGGMASARKGSENLASLSGTMRKRLDHALGSDQTVVTGCPRCLLELEKLNTRLKLVAARHILQIYAGDSK